MPGPHTIDVSTATFQAEVIRRSAHTPVVVDFWAAWCGPCRVLGPTLEKLAAEGGGQWVLAKVDTDANQDLAMQFGIQGIPAVKAFVDGKVVDEFVGVRGEADIRRWLQGIIPSPADEHALAGRAALADGQLDAAAASFQAALGLDGGHPGALLGLAEVALGMGDLDSARALLGRVPPGHEAAVGGLQLRLEGAAAGDPAALLARVQADPRDHDSRYALATALHAAGDTEGALGHLLEIVRRDRKWRDDEGRRAMLRIFDDVGPRSPVAEKWRQKLAMELF